MPDVTRVPVEVEGDVWEEQDEESEVPGVLERLVAEQVGHRDRSDNVEEVERPDSKDAAEVKLTEIDLRVDLLFSQQEVCDEESAQREEDRDADLRELKRSVLGDADTRRRREGVGGQNAHRRLGSD